jgi:hypothetical protein
MKTSNLKYLYSAVKQRSWMDTLDKLTNWLDFFPL